MCIYIYDITYRSWIWRIPHLKNTGLPPMLAQVYPPIAPMAWQPYRPWRRGSFPYFAIWKHAVDAVGGFGYHMVSPFLDFLGFKATCWILLDCVKKNVVLIFFGEGLTLWWEPEKKTMPWNSQHSQASGNGPMWPTQVYTSGASQGRRSSGPWDFYWILQVPQLPSPKIVIASAIFSNQGFKKKSMEHLLIIYQNLSCTYQKRWIFPLAAPCQGPGWYGGSEADRAAVRTHENLERWI